MQKTKRNMNEMEFNGGWRDEGGPGEDLRIYYRGNLIDTLTWDNDSWFDQDGFKFTAGRLGRCWKVYRAALVGLTCALGPAGLPGVVDRLSEVKLGIEMPPSWPSGYGVTSHRASCVRHLLSSDLSILETTVDVAHWQAMAAFETGCVEELREAQQVLNDVKGLARCSDPGPHQRAPGHAR